MKDFTGKLLAEVCPDATLEPDIQPLEGESLVFASDNHEDNARADIRARGFWGGNHQCTFFDVKVSNSSHASDVRKMPRNENMSNTLSKWSISSVTPLRLLPLRQNGELGIHVLQEIAFSPVGEEMRGLFIHTELDPHPPQFFLAPVCYHVHTGSSIKHQAHCEGM